jgi:hypothetical protein
MCPDQPSIHTLSLSSEWTFRDSGSIQQEEVTKSP